MRPYERGLRQALSLMGLQKRADMELIETIPSWHDRFLAKHGASGEYAPGIPDRSHRAPLPDIRKPTPWKMSLQEHHAERAGLHYDLRLIDPDTGHAHSWALPKAKLPAPGEVVLAVQQPTHTSDYSLNFGKEAPQEITSGYGKGRVKIKALEDIDVYHSKPDETGTRLRFNVYKSTGPEEYALVRTSKGQDLLVNKTMTFKRVPHLGLGEKPKLKEKEYGMVDVEDNTHVMMPKYDGAHTVLDLARADKIPRLFSYRIPKKHTAGVIEHTHKVPALLNARVPKELRGTVVRAETIGVTPDGRAVPATDVGGLLNARVPVSRNKQQATNIELRPVLLDVERFRGKPVKEMPFSERYKLLQQVGTALNLPVTEAAYTPEEKRRMLEDIKNKLHPLTQEGVVLRSLTHGPLPAIKSKLRPDHDVYVREMFEAVSQTGEPLGRAGGFHFSWTPKGPIVGRVGTGFTHAEAKDMWENKHNYHGRVAKVEAELKTPKGALQKPSFIEWHLDKGKIF